MIISDFDGTITTKDTNVAVWSHFNYQESEKLRDIYRNNEKLGMKWLLSEEYKNLDIVRSEFESFLQNHIKLESTFKNFLNYIKGNEYKFGIISGGFIDYINIILKKYDINIDFPIHANKLIFPEDKNSTNNIIETKFIEPQNKNTNGFGPTSTPKGEIISNYKKKYFPIFYLGDGRTDRHALGYADYIFTKKESYFEKFCIQNNYEHFQFNNFNQVAEIINNIMN